MAHSLRAAGCPARVHDRPGVARVDFDLGWLGVAARHQIVERLGERRWVVALAVAPTALVARVGLARVDVAFDAVETLSARFDGLAGFCVEQYRSRVGVPEDVRRLGGSEPVVDGAESAPAREIPKIAVTNEAELYMNTETVSSFSTPRSRRAFAKRLARSSRAAYVSRVSVRG